MEIQPEPLTSTAFAPFGEVLEAAGEFRLINDGLCQRHHDLARLDFGSETHPPGRPGISIFKAQPRALPYTFDLIERHPHGSQAFIPLSDQPFLVIVSESRDAMPRAFVTSGTQGVNLRRGTWHGVLTPLGPPGLFAVLDRIGEGRNLEEYRYPHPWQVLEAGFHPAPQSI